VFGKSVIYMSSGKPMGSMIALQGLAVNRSLGSEKIVLYVVCFAYSLLSIL